jgi:serine/threonine-protein kinase
MIERNLSERYRLEGRIGQGGMAIVYSGMDTVLRRRVAVKVLRPQLAADEDFVQRFYSEAQHAAKLSHPNIVNIYDVGREGENYFIVMELIEGATLAEMIESDGKLPEAIAIDFAAQICNGLAFAHRQGLLHRDVKPANVLITRDDVAKLSDFGIARAVTTQTMTVTAPGLVMGSVYYISPEQAQGRELGQTSDLYSLGVVLYQMLTGKLPYTGESPITVALKHVTSPVPAVDAEDPTISPALSGIVKKLMQKDPNERFGSALETAKALREAREHPLATPAGAPSPQLAAAGPGASRTIPNPKPRPSKLPDRATLADDDPQARDARRRNVFGVAAIALILATFFGYFVAQRVFNPFGAGTVALDNFTGAQLEAAEKQLDAAGLHYTVISVPSDAVAADRVVRQYPPAAGNIPAATVVTLYVSNGLPRVDLIDVRQYSSDDAQRYLRNAKLVPKLTEVYDKSPRGTVLAQRPPPGTNVPIRSVVALVISKGQKPVYVPELVSLVVSDAQKALAERQLTLAISERDPSDQIPAGDVLSQTPVSGTPLDPGSTVNVVISSGPPQITVPDVSGKVLGDAQAALTQAGLQATIEYFVDATSALGTVLKEDPGAGSPARKGSTVTLDIAVPGVVPDVVGKPVDQAQTTLQTAGYKIGNTAYVQEGSDGTVARTEPASGMPLRPGETVLLYVNGTSPESP